MGTFLRELLRQFACKLQNIHILQFTRELSIARGGKQATAFNTSNMRTQ